MALINRNMGESFGIWQGVDIGLIEKEHERVSTERFADAVTGRLEAIKDEPTLFGPRTFASELHHQNKGKYLIVDVNKGKPGVVDEWTISEPIPLYYLLER